MRQGRIIDYGSIPFVKHELEAVDLFIDDRTLVMMPVQHWRLLERIFQQHVNETTQKVEVYDDVRGFTRRIISVEALSIYLPKGTLDIEQRLREQAFCFPRIDLVRSDNVQTSL